MARRRKSNGHARPNGGEDTGSAAAGTGKRGRKPDVTPTSQRYPSQTALDRFLATWRTRKNDSVEANTRLSEHVGHAIKTEKWPRWGVRQLLALMKMDAATAQANLRWLNDAFGKTDHGKQTDILEQIEEQERAEAETTPAV